MNLAYAVDHAASTFHNLEAQVTNSYAHNSFLYRYLEESAGLRDIVNFYKWDALQPPFVPHLERWLARLPKDLQPALQAHITIEVDQKHLELFYQMLTYLEGFVSGSPKIDPEILKNLNYPFTEECFNEQTVGYFLGSFFATELMSGKRSLQVLKGLHRLGLAHSPALKYLEVHAGADLDHPKEVYNNLILPMTSENPDLIKEIHFGISDRLQRSESFLVWYQDHQVGQN